jgi:hypothetical protein
MHAALVADQVRCVEKVAEVTSTGWLGVDGTCVGFSADAGDSPIGQFVVPSSFYELAAVAGVLLVATIERLELRDGNTGELRRVVPAPLGASFQGVAEGRFWFEVESNGAGRAGSLRRAIGMAPDGSFGSELLLPDDASLLRGSGGRLAYGVSAHFDAFDLSVFSSEGEVCFRHRVFASTVAVGIDAVHIASYGQPVVTSWPLPSSNESGGPSDRSSSETPAASPGEILDLIPTPDGWVELREATTSKRAIGPASGAFTPVGTTSDFYLSRIADGQVVASRQLDAAAWPIAVDADQVWLVSGRSPTNPSRSSPVDLVVLDSQLDEITRWPAGAGAVVQLAVSTIT